MQRHVMGPLVTKQLSNSLQSSAARTGRTVAHGVNSRECDQIHEIDMLRRTSTGPADYYTCTKYMRYRKYASDLAYSVTNAITVQVINDILKYQFSPSGPLKLVGPCALHMLHSPLLRHCQRHALLLLSPGVADTPALCSVYSNSRGDVHHHTGEAPKFAGRRSEAKLV